MQIKSILAAAASAALLTSPAWAAKPANPGGDHPQAPAAGSHGKAYGRYCAGQSKKHVAGQKGTPFSQCVKAMAKLDSGAAKSARAACKTLSKKHVKGQKGTPYSRCIVAAAKLRHDQHSSDDSTTGTTGPTGPTGDTGATGATGATS